uniref:Secreted protein n=1 Tax=Trichogramma kaykai TaxID=54128 RepID=A0ABD2XF30_9HYME
MKNRISRAVRASVRRTRYGCYRAATTAVAAAAQVHEYKPRHHESCAVFAKALRTIILIGFCWRSYCAREMPLFAKRDDRLIESTTRRRRRRPGVPLSLLHHCTQSLFEPILLQQQQTISDCRSCSSS